MSIPKPLDALSIKEFRYFALARLFYIAALRMLFTVVGYLVYHITNSKFQLGLIGLSEVLPAIALALYAGIIVDKANKRKLILQSEWAFFISSIGLVIVAYLYQTEAISGQTTIYFFLFGMFTSGIIRAFNGPTHHAILAQIVPKEKLIAASTFSSMTWLSAAIIGPLLAGVLLATLPIVYVFIIISVFVLIAIFNVYKIHPKEILVSKKANNWESIKEGLRFVWNTKIMLNAITLDLFAVLFGGVVALIPVFAKDILHVNQIALGWLSSAEHIGCFILMLLLFLFPFSKKQGMKLLISVACFGVCIILFAISTNFWFSFIALIAAGLFDGVSVVVRGNIMQLYTPDEMRGRVSSVNGMFINSANEIGQFESGMAAAILGTVPSVICGGSITLLVVILV
jgi:MFS family permease